MMARLSDVFSWLVTALFGVIFLLLVFGILLGHFLWGPASGRTSPEPEEPK